MNLKDLNEKRKKLNLTDKKIARYVDCGKSTVSAVMNDRYVSRENSHLADEIIFFVHGWVYPELYEV